MTAATAPSLPTEHTDPVNAQILAVSEDQIKGFHRHPFQFVAERSGLPLETVLERVRAMLKAGVIRRVRQTFLANKLADGGLVAWNILRMEKLEAAFDFMSKEDPFSGHVVLRSTDREISGSDFRLWTTVKVPRGKQISGALRRAASASSAPANTSSCSPRRSSPSASVTCGARPWRSVTRRRNSPKPSCPTSWISPRRNGTCCIP